MTAKVDDIVDPTSRGGQTGVSVYFPMSAIKVHTDHCFAAG
jgi:hypothetical protein